MSFSLLLSRLLLLTATISSLFPSPVNALPRPLIPTPSTKTLDPRLGVRKPGGFELPITRHVNNDARKLRRRGTLSGEIGLGNNADLLYTVPVEIDGTVAAFNIDTGSSDLWLVTDQCNTNTCSGATVTRYPSANLATSSFNPSTLNSSLPSGPVDTALFYGDSTTGTFAKGIIGQAVAAVAGIAMERQHFGAINDTNNLIVQFGTSGIFGLGFPTGSKIQEATVISKFGAIDDTDDFIRSTWADGPLLSRISMTKALELPMFSISLQRNTIDIGGEGMLTVGRLPEGVNEGDLTWVPVRLYEPEDGGLEPPTFARNEVYPFRWEIDIEGVFLDGVQLADSAIPASGGVSSTRKSALIDTGNSLIRGPQDVVNSILTSVSRTYDPAAAAPVARIPCSEPHTLAFQIGGKLFPVDPRDFIGPFDGDATTIQCVADNVVSTDAPGIGATFSWSLGDPFMRSNLVAFHYGNLTHPSVDPPRIGFLSLVPSNANDLYKQAIDDAVAVGAFEQTLDIAPTQSALDEGEITVSPGFGVATAIPTPSAPPAVIINSDSGPGRNADGSEAATEKDEARSGASRVGWTMGALVSAVLVGSVLV